MTAVHVTHMQQTTVVIMTMATEIPYFSKYPLSNQWVVSAQRCPRKIHHSERKRASILHISTSELQLPPPRVVGYGGCSRRGGCALRNDDEPGPPLAFVPPGWRAVQRHSMRLAGPRVCCTLLRSGRCYSLRSAVCVDGSHCHSCARIHAPTRDARAKPDSRTRSRNGPCWYSGQRHWRR